MQRIYDKCRRREPLSREEAYRLYDQAPLQELALVADEVRRAMVPDPEVVTWQIDRNVNITNVCISGCKFCNFHCKPHDTQRAFVTSREEYREKIAQTLALGGDQLLLQGGLHPQLGIDFYEELFRDLKRMFPRIRLHALGAPEVAHIARISGLTTLETLRRQAIDNGVEFIACQMSMDVMGVKREELLDDVTVGGVATYMERAEEANVNLFI